MLLCSSQAQEMYMFEASGAFLKHAREESMMAMSRAGMAKHAEPTEDSSEHEVIFVGFFERRGRDTTVFKPTVTWRFLVGISWCSR